jgi:hypothetical protein
LAKKKANTKCRWGCGADVKGRKCGICVPCIEKRDARDVALDKDFTKYVPPQDRPGHRFFKRQGRGTGRKLSEAHKEALRKGRLVSKKGSRINDLNKSRG